MRHGTSTRRNRNRNNNNRRGTPQRNQVFDSNGPDVRIRGTAHQVAEKYLALAKDSASAGDHTAAENYYQHAEHYIRIINDLSDGQDADKIKGANPSKEVADDEGNRIAPKQEPKQAQKRATTKDDLSLPSSILGPEVTIKSKSEETRETESAE